MATSIAQDKIFIDNLYYYRYFKNIWKNNNEDANTSRQARRKTIELYINLIARCVQCIREDTANVVENNHLKYVYWKAVIIEQNIDDFLSELHGAVDATEQEQMLIQQLNVTRDLYEQIKIEYLRLNKVEEAKIEEYLKAYGILQRSKRVSLNRKLVENVAHRFADYLTTITTKRCLNSFGRTNCDQSVLQDEANYILRKLEVSGCTACKNLCEKAWNAFNSFRDNDENNRLSQEQEIITALEIAHMRANETRLQRFQRQLSEAIAAIELWLKRGLDHTFQFSKVVVAPIIHPWQTLQNLWFAISHPMVTARAVIKWVKENPWKAAFLVLGGIAVGVLIGFGVGGPLIAGAALAIEIIGGVVAGVTAGVAVGVIPMLAAAGQGGLLVHHAERGEKVVREKYEVEVQCIREEVIPIQRQERDEQYIRKGLLETRARLEKELEILHRVEDDGRKLREQQLRSMSSESIHAAHSEIQNTHAFVTTEIQSVKEARREAEKNLTAINQDHVLINSAQAAAIRIQKRSTDLLGSFTDKTGLPMETDM